MISSEFIVTFLVTMFGNIQADSEDPPHCVQAQPTCPIFKRTVCEWSETGEAVWICRGFFESVINKPKRPHHKNSDEAHLSPKLAGDSKSEAGLSESSDDDSGEYLVTFGSINLPNSPEGDHSATNGGSTAVHIAGTPSTPPGTDFKGFEASESTLNLPLATSASFPLHRLSSGSESTERMLSSSSESTEQASDSEEPDIQIGTFTIPTSTSSSTLQSDSKESTGKGDMEYSLSGSDEAGESSMEEKPFQSSRQHPESTSAEPDTSQEMWTISQTPSSQSLSESEDSPSSMSESFSSLPNLSNLSSSLLSEANLELITRAAAQLLAGNKASTPVESEKDLSSSESFDEVEESTDDDNQTVNENENENEKGTELESSMEEDAADSQTETTSFEQESNDQNAAQVSAQRSLSEGGAQSEIPEGSRSIPTDSPYLTASTNGQQYPTQYPSQYPTQYPSQYPTQQLRTPTMQQNLGSGSSYPPYWNGRYWVNGYPNLLATPVPSYLVNSYGNAMNRSPQAIWPQRANSGMGLNQPGMGSLSLFSVGYNPPMVLSMVVPLQNPLLSKSSYFNYQPRSSPVGIPRSI